MSLTTLPQLSFKTGISLDKIREVVLADPALRSLGTVVGASRGVTPEECEKIKAALAAKGKTRRRRQTA